MNLFFWRKETPTTDAYAPYEEIDAKRTNKLGYFFLILMVIFGVFQGNQFLSSIQETVDRPTPNSNCSSELFSRASDRTTQIYYRGYNDNSNCAFSEREIRLGLDKAYEQSKPLYSQIENLQSQINSQENILSNLSRQKTEILDEYQTALIEEMATPNDAVLDSQTLGTGYTSQKQNINQVKAEINQLEIKKIKIEQELANLANSYLPSFKKAESEYQFELKKYEFIVFIVSLILISPVFYFVWVRYNQAKLRRSEYTLIWGGAVATFGIILAQILLVFVYEILPRGILEALFAFFAAFEFLWTILFYFSFILVPLFFGSLIYLIQKKLYNKQAVLMRTLKSGHCPGCSLKISPDMNNCPICGYKIKTQCQTCNHMTLSGGKFCSVCGTRHPVIPQSN